MDKIYLKCTFMVVKMNCSYTLDISHSEHSYTWITSHTEYETIFCVGKWSHWDSCLWSIANWHGYLGPILHAASHAVSGSGQLLCRDQAGSIERKGGPATIWWSKTLGGLILGHKLLCHCMTGTWPNTLFHFLQSSWGRMWGVWVCPYICIFGLFQSILNRAAKIIFIEHKSDQVTPLLSHCT